MSNLKLGRHRLGRYKLAGKATAAAALIADYPVRDDAIYINVFDASGAKTQVITGDAQTSPLVSVEFETIVTGCGKFTLVLKKNAVLLAYGQRIDIHLYGDYYPWYSGYVTEIPKPGSTEETDSYEGNGFFSQLNEVRVNRIYTDTEISAIAKNILTVDVIPKKNVLYRGSKIYSTGYTATRVRFNLVKVSDAMKTLAEMAVDYVYGVDERREFFFKPLVTTINEDARFWVGRHVMEFKPREDRSKIVNFFYVKYGSMNSGGSNIYSDEAGNPIAFEDATSQAAYGIIENVLTLPNEAGAADVERWAYAQLDAKKNPARTATLAKFTPAVMRRKIKPEGMVAVTSENGLHNYEYPLKSVKRKWEAKNQQLTLTMGDYTPGIDSYILKMYRDIQNNEQIQDSNNEQLKG